MLSSIIMSDIHISHCHGRGTSCSCQPSLQAALSKYFGFSSFRSGQMEAARAVLHGQDCFVRMSTGSGKSLCMFLGPLCRSKEAVGIVISPLVGLMEQHVKLLRGAGVSAVRVGDTSLHMYDSVANGQYRFVFVSPELVTQSPWRNIFQTAHYKKHLVMVAVDEAHCISEWGSDFRKAFSRLGGLRALTNAPFMALSASAPPTVAKTIELSLHMKSPVQVLHGLDRPNIFFSCSKSKGLARDLAGLMNALKSPSSSEAPKTLVFCTTKNNCYKVYNYLSGSVRNKYLVSMYHASLTHGTKTKVHDDFKSGSRLRCLSATIAFGMGMDIPDVELVVIYGIPDTVSQLYQLCGRAGRGGCQARAHWILNCDENKIRDPTLKSLVTDTENCLRSTLITAVGGTVEIQSNCCMVCHPSAFSSDARLDVLRVGKAPPRKKRRMAVRKVDAATIENLKTKLVEEREKFISENAYFRILGPQVVCPDYTVETICSSAKFISVENDMNCFSLRTELRDRFFKVVLSVVNS